jgi:tetratricopeptide (TPR) repeat protein
MPKMKFWFRLAVLSSCVLSAWAQIATPPAKPLAEKSALDAVLFYQVLMGELNARQGSPGAGFSMLLDAARKAHDPALFQRAVDIALQAQSGDAALQAAQTWKRELPQSIEPNRYILQILLALNRVEEAGKALSVTLQDLPLLEQSEAITSIPRVFGRVQDKKAALEVIEKALAQYTQQPHTAASTWTTLGRMSRDASLLDRAAEAALKGHTADLNATGPLILALSLLNTSGSTIKPMLDEAMQGAVPAELRLGYARALIAQQLYPEAMKNLGLLNARHPAFAAGWLIHGLLLQENGQIKAAEQHLARYVDLAAKDKEPEQQAGLAEALMALAQMAQEQGQLERANQWLAQMPAGVDPIRLASRQADVLAQQGRMDEARLVLAQIKTSTPEQAQQKILVQSQWLREHRQAESAYSLVKKALEAAPQETELLSELSLVCEKLKRFDEMERLLRQIMTLKPQDAQAFNALGYSLADRGIRLDEARQLVTQALIFAPEDAYIKDSLGWVAFKQGQHQEALELLQAAYKARPDAEIAAHLGEVLWSTGKNLEAATIWRQGLLLKADNETLLETITRFKFKP